MAILILCVKIFFVRILDVSLGTFRTLLTVKGKTLYASIIGFIEVIIWFLIVKEALNTDIDSIWVAVSYSGGFATGTYIGGLISKKFIRGNLTVQIITSNEYSKLVNELRDAGYAVSVLNVRGKNEDEEKYMLFIEIENKSLYHLQKLIKKLDPEAFIVVNESKYVYNGYIRNGK
ncbi:MAG TPA: DUF5698 domain-containing protein [Bacilli bacterium]|nr:DUF5698 domain-containing protein [Bacilli bacterium]